MRIMCKLMWKQFVHVTHILRYLLIECLFRFLFSFSVQIAVPSATAATTTTAALSDFATTIHRSNARQPWIAAIHTNSASPTRFPAEPPVFPATTTITSAKWGAIPSGKPTSIQAIIDQRIWDVSVFLASFIIDWLTHCDCLYFSSNRRAFLYLAHRHLPMCPTVNPAVCRSAHCRPNNKVNSASGPSITRIRYRVAPASR